MEEHGRTRLGDAIWFPVSLGSWFLTLCAMGGIVACSLPVVPFVPFERFQARWVHPAVGKTLWLIFSRSKTIIDPKFDRSRTNVFVQNHVSAADGQIACSAIPVPICGLENADHLQIPGYGWLMRLANAIPVHRRKQGMYELIARAFRERASRGISILTYPEAHRTVDGGLRPFKRGVFRIARDCGLPIVPVAVRGAYRLIPKGRVSVRPSTIEVYIAPQIETAGLTDEQLEEVIARTRAVIRAWVDDRQMKPELCTEPLTTPVEQVLSA